MNNLSRALAYLEKLPSAISGSGGHNATLRAACECVRFGLSESEMWEAMSWYNSNRCQPIWKEHELRHKINDARKIATATRAPVGQGKKTVRAFTPPVITAKRPFKPVCQRSRADEEAWWAIVWRSRNLPDPATVTPAEFRAAIEQHRADTGRATPLAIGAMSAGGGS